MTFREDHALETYKSLMMYGSTGIKFVLAANGAAAIAVMTFLGHFVAAKNTDVPDFQMPLAFFVTGVLIGGLAVVSAYFTQLALYNESLESNDLPLKKGHVWWLRISVALIFLGMSLFAIGALCSVAVLT